MADYVQVPVEIPASVMDDLSKLGELFDATRDAAQLGQSIIERLGREREETGFRSDLETVAYVIFGKGFKTFHAARILCVCGCGTDALTLCASLFENLVDLLYIRRYPEPRARAYLAFEQVDKYYQAKEVLQRSDLTEEERCSWRSRLDWVSPHFEQHRDMFPIQSCWCKSSGDGSKPAKVTIRDRAEEVGFGKAYNIFYSIFCSYKHTAPSAAAGFMFQHDDGVDAILGPNVKGVYNATMHSARYILDLCGVFQGVYKLGMEAEVKALIKRIEETGAQVLRAQPDLCE